MMNCDVIRDLMPLYADEVCSDQTRQMVEEHARECPECAKLLEELRDRGIEADLKEEKNEVIRYQARRFKRRSAAVGSGIAGLFMIPVVVCLIVNLCAGAALGWFYVVLASLAVAASLVVVPLMVPQDKLFWTFCAFYVSLMALLAVCCAYTHGSWFFTAAGAVAFGLGAVFLPFLVRARPVRQWLGPVNRVLLVLGLDVILFANMMNMITLHSKSLFSTLKIAGLCAAAVVLLVMLIKTKRGEEVK